ncbi:MAG: hypothetical protein GTO16_03835 [Candidatus Aminicenantes bacterium]|nr:hypothetical protein [Candidatus Aminicenantes bacterium]
MNCEESKNLMTVSVFGKLTHSEKTDLEEHLRECQKCARIYERTAHLSPQHNKKEDIPLPDKEKSWQIISAKIFQKKRDWKVFFPYKKLALAASALVVVFILGFIVGKQFFFPGSREIRPESTALKGYDSPIQRYAENLELILVSFMNRIDSQRQEEISEIEKKVIKDILVQTRLLKYLVSQRDDPYVQQLIEDVELIMIGISNLSPQDQASADLLARLIRENEIKFKLKTLITSKTIF